MDYVQLSSARGLDEMHVAQRDVRHVGRVERL